MNKNPSVVLIKFNNAAHSAEFFNLYAEGGMTLDTTHIGFQTPKRIFTNWNFTPVDYKYYKRCLEMKLKKLLHKVSVFDGIIYVKDNISSRKVPVSTPNELAALGKLLNGQNPTASAASKRKPKSPPSINQVSKMITSCN